MSEEVVAQTEAEVITAPEAEVTAAPVVEESKPVKTFTEDEVNSIVSKRLAKESRKLSRQAELEVENRMLREQVTKREVKAEPSSPSQDQYNTYEEYLEAKAEWIADKRVEAKLAEREQKVAQSKVEAERTDMVKEWQKKVDAAVTKYSDYNEALEAVDHVEIPPALQSAIMESDVGADLAYHLATHLEDFERIVALKPHAALMALGKLEDKIASAPSAPKKQPVSKAPEPIKPLAGKGEVSTSHDPKDDMATFIRKRNLEKGRIK